MIQASLFVPPVYQNNRIFDLSNSTLNRDNCLYAFYLLRQHLLEHDINLSTSDLSPPGQSSVVIYNEMPKQMPSKSDKGKSYLLLFESELIRPDNWDLEKHQYFEKIFTWHDDFVDNEKYFKMNFSHSFPKHHNNKSPKKENLCTLIAGNHKSHHPLELYSQRSEAIKWFGRHHPDKFDFYGTGWDRYTSSNRYLRFLLMRINMPSIFKPNFCCYRGVVSSKKETLEKYKFAICYENAKDLPGYITEKIFDCFFAGCVPIYWGASNVVEHIPKDCFIDKRDFPTYELLYNFIAHMHDEIYKQYLTNIAHYLASETSNQYKANYFAETITEIVLRDVNQVQN